MLFDTVCIVGVGLIGGSFGMALREKKLARQVIGAVRRQETIDAAFQKGAVDNASLEMEEAARGADLVFIATPVGQIPDKCRELLPFIRSGAIVTDAGSTKSTLVEECTPVFGQKAHFVGSHPMAGSERVGVEHANADLFDNATWILTPTPETPKDSIEKLQRLVEAIGAKPLVMDAKTHDALLAVTSHLPHITASLLVHLFMQTRDDHAVVEQLIAGGWRPRGRARARLVPCTSRRRPTTQSARCWCSRRQTGRRPWPRSRSQGTSTSRCGSPARSSSSCATRGS